MFSLNEYFAEKKGGMFPDIVDWSNPQPDLRFHKYLDDLSQKEWFWFHSSAYSLINIGQYVLPCFGMAGLTIAYHGYWFMWIFAGMFAFLGYKGLMAGLSYSDWKGTTFSDIYLREYNK